MWSCGITVVTCLLTGFVMEKEKWKGVIEFRRESLMSLLKRAIWINRL